MKTIVYSIYKNTSSGEKQVKKLLIIGGGVSGLSAGIHARLLGFESLIVEKNPNMGGICTSWTREGYHIDASMHWLTGTQEGNDTNDMWKTLNVLGDHVEIIKNDIQGVYEFGGEKITVYADPEKFRQELLRIAPEDKKAIDELLKDIKAVGGMDMPAEAPVEYLPLTKKMKLLIPIIKMGMQVKNRATMVNEEYAKRFKSPALRQYFSVWPQGQDQHMGYLFKSAMMIRGNADYPRGGSEQIIKNMLKKYTELGGEYMTSKEAVSIEVKNGELDCVRFKDGSTLSADWLLCACDPHITLKTLLRDEYTVPEFEERYNDRVNYFLNSSVIVFFGLDFIPEDMPCALHFEGSELKVASVTMNRYSLRSFACEPSFAPEGHLLLSMDITQRDDDYEYWEALRKDMPAYKAEKQRIADELIKRVTERFPSWAGHIKVVDILTPMTYKRYTGAYHGAWMAFRSSSGGKRMTHTGEIPGLKNIVLTGQWLQPSGGLPVAGAMSKFSVQRIAKKEGMDFRI